MCSELSDVSKPGVFMPGKASSCTIGQILLIDSIFDKADIGSHKADIGSHI